ncbi:bifunctional 3-phenylpropionate/cinnamic acid dioxygenase ferredoxin subunit [Williamsia muralis]|uniref:Bifunctional 3-phenylpropionate/cinnamic acid dioxygenase ferredoxin subunit n=1 Tax=Williamsia marianensis TaxID=85044 RepID=A0A2G3PGJ3_WILMA|nr:bifunctional 3-phenylpropionate/cinnamic acid dioxygenase ferredoxin subunit [Williamsia marianensis]
MVHCSSSRWASAWRDPRRCAADCAGSPRQRGRPDRKRRPVSDLSTDIWVLVCTTDELGVGEGVKVGTCPPIALFNIDGDYFAIDDTCSHAEYSLTDGYLDGDQIECELHYATFSVRTGEALTAPATDPVGTYPVRVEDNNIYVAATQRCVIDKFRS